MAEFGHTAISGAGFHMDTWGAGPFVIKVGEKSFRFEDSDRFGPSILTKKDKISKTQPGEKSSFWDAYHAWRRQGRKVEQDGLTCIFTPLRPTIHYYNEKRLIVRTDEGDEGGEEIFRPIENAPAPPATPNRKDG